MPLREKVIYGFIAGEVSPDFYGRTDLSKYEFGVALARNFIVDYRGGLMTRGGFEFCVPVQKATLETKLAVFTATADDYLLLFGDEYIRPMRNGNYLLENAKNLESLTAGECTITAHGWENLDLVYISEVGGATEYNGRYFEIFGKTANTFQLRMVDADAFSPTGYGAYTSGGKVARVVTIATGYPADKLSGLAFEQRYNECRLTHLEFPPATLTYVTDTNWALADVVFGSTVPAPQNLVLDPSDVGTAGVAFAVTAVKAGIESLPSPYKFNTVTADYTVVEGSMLVNWNAVGGAEEYYVYRSLVLPIGSEISYAQTLGYIGRAVGPQFTDNNVIPDFTKAPPLGYNPFAPRAITEITVTAPGTGYTNLSQVNVTGGTGFIGYPVVSTTGELLSVVIINGGTGYATPAVTVTLGAGATFSTVHTPPTGGYPALFKVFQQRGVYAATINEPMRVWASKPGDLDNFDISPIVNAGDGYSFQLDSREVRPIQHMITLRTGLLMFSSRSITLLRAEEGKAVSGVNALAEPQAYKGANNATPLAIDLDVLFAQRHSSAVNAMLYTEYNNTFTLQDVAILSNHLMGKGKEITQMVWQAEPHKLVWALREDGTLLSLTYEREQSVFAWSQHQTQGLFKGIAVVLEGSEEKLYAVTSRRVKGVWRKFIERQTYRETNLAEDYFGIDCGLQTQLNYPAQTLYAAAVVAGYDFTTTAPAFAGMSVGDHIYFHEGKFEVVTYHSNSRVTVSVLRAPVNQLHVNNLLAPVDAGDWGWATPIADSIGLWHLDGETVSLNIDGDCYLNVPVVAGKAALPISGTRISAGLQYFCDAQTLPPNFSEYATEGKVHSIVSANVRLRNTRGLATGNSTEDLIELKDRTDVDWGDEMPLRNDMADILMAANFDELGSMYFRQAYPLPAKILSFTLTVDVGDE